MLRYNKFGAHADVFGFIKLMLIIADLHAIFSCCNRQLNHWAVL